jgi:glycosyltransferase involved in cell wall biosynthesis
MSAKRVLFVINSLARGGAEGQLLELLKRLDRRLFTPTLMLLSATGVERMQGIDCQIEVLEIPAGGYTKSWKVLPNAIVGLFRFVGLLREIRPDLVQTFLPASAIIATIGSRVARCPAPIVVGRRSLINYRPRFSVAAALDRFCTTHLASFAVGNSEAVTRELIETDHLDRARTRTIYNGVRIPESADRQDLRKRLGIEQNTIVFAMVAHYRAHKGHDDLLNIASKIFAQRRDCAFVLLGEDQGTQAAVKQHVAEKKLENVRVLTKGFTPEQVYGSADIYLCTSEAEGFSNSILEAMANALPVIATRVGGNAEAVKNEETGFVLPVHDVDGFVEKARLLMDDAKLREQMGARGKERVAQRFSLAAMVHGYEELYSEILKGKSRENTSLGASA